MKKVERTGQIIKNAKREKHYNNNNSPKNQHAVNIITFYIFANTIKRFIDTVVFSIF